MTFVDRRASQAFHRGKRRYFITKFASLLGALLVTWWAPSALSEQHSMFNGWDLIVDTDPITDLGRGIAMKLGEGGAIVVKCDAMNANDNRMYVSFISDEYLGGVGQQARRPLTVRFDDQLPITRLWTYDDDSAAFTERSSIDLFVLRMVKSKRMLIRSTNYRGEHLDASIELGDGREAIGRAYKACSQKPPFDT